MTAGHIAFITPLYAAFFGIMLVTLSWRVTSLRRKFDGHHAMNEGGHNELTAAVRARDNVIEYLPLALLLMWMLETMQFNAMIIHLLGVLLIVARLLHIHGLNVPGGDGITRRIGTRLTWVHITLCALMAFLGSYGIIF